jgi:hypothetical protein
MAIVEHSSRERVRSPHLSQTIDAQTSEEACIMPQNTLGNQAVLARVEGLTGRTFNRILGAPDGDTSTHDQSFGKDELAQYLEHQLEFAKGEWFSGTKINGAADGIIAELDKDGDGRVGWEEFQEFRGSMLRSLAPGLSEGASAAEIQARASETFAGLEAQESDFSGLVAHTQDQVAPDMDHRGLIAQLGALLLLDAADLDQQSSSPRDRSLSETEWLTAASEFSSSER